MLRLSRQIVPKLNIGILNLHLSRIRIHNNLLNRKFTFREFSDVVRKPINNIHVTPFLARVGIVSVTFQILYCANILFMYR